MKYVFIVNPTADNGKAKEWSAWIEKACLDKGLKAGIDYEVIETKEKGHATQIAAAYNALGPHNFISLGGDGTVDEIVQAIAGTESTIGIVPCGSGNDFAREFACYKGMTPLEIIKDVLDGDSCEVEYFIINGKRACSGIVSVGFDARVVKRSQVLKEKGVPSEKLYLKSITHTLLNNKPLKLQITIDNGKKEVRWVTLAAFCKSRNYGGGLPIAPMANVTKDNLTVAIGKKMSLPVLIFLLSKLKKGKHADKNKKENYKYRRYINFYEDVKEILIEAKNQKEKLLFNINGELEEFNTVHLKVAPDKLKVIKSKNFIMQKDAA